MFRIVRGIDNLGIESYCTYKSLINNYFIVMQFQKIHGLMMKEIILNLPKNFKNLLIQTFGGIDCLNHDQNVEEKTQN